MPFHFCHEEVAAIRNVLALLLPFAGAALLFARRWWSWVRERLRRRSR